MIDNLEFYLNSIKDKFSVFKDYPDYKLFTVLCIKYFFYYDDTVPFDQYMIDEFITDGANDGGIDAIFNDPNSTENDMIIVQSKYYNNTNLKAEEIAGNICKIKGTLSNLKNNKTSQYTKELVTQFRNVNAEMSEDASIRIVVFTSYSPKKGNQKNKINKIVSECFVDDEVEINYRKDIVEQIDMYENGKLLVDYDILEIDDENNCLKYKNSAIFNVSALSLKQLYQKRRNSLLGMNLRYYVRKKEVDDGIQQSVENNPEDFWYKNNGIVIACEKYEAKNNELKLENFSIINGGQTTNRISEIDFDEDFYIQCKVVTTKGNNQEEKDNFVLSIAEATNAQKPIKNADLVVNKPEQKRLRERLAKYHVYYAIKKGEKIPKEYKEIWQYVKMNDFGKFGLAAFLQMPGAARSNPKKMFDSEYYKLIFGYDAKEGVVVDLLKVKYYYENFKRDSKKISRESNEQAMINNGTTYIFAMITLLCKINQGVFSSHDVFSSLSRIDELKNLISDMGKMERLILKENSNEKEIFDNIFSILCEEILTYCYNNEQEKNEGVSLEPSNYLKNDINYYKSMIKRLLNRYNAKRSVLKESIDAISGNVN